jgi:hypothetical protein
MNAPAGAEPGVPGPGGSDPDVHGSNHPAADPDRPPWAVGAGRDLVRASWWGTALYSAVAVAATVWPEAGAPAVVAVSLLLFLGGSVAFLWGYFVALERSRTELIGVGGLFFLAGCAPPSVQRSMMLSLGIQTTVAVVTASLRLYTALAFGILVPMWGLGLAGLWGARHGVFPQRPDVRARKPGKGS